MEALESLCGLVLRVITLWNLGTHESANSPTTVQKMKNGAKLHAKRCDHVASFYTLLRRFSANNPDVLKSAIAFGILIRVYHVHTQTKIENCSAQRTPTTVKIVNATEKIGKAHHCGCPCLWFGQKVSSTIHCRRKEHFSISNLWIVQM